VLAALPPWRRPGPDHTTTVGSGATGPTVRHPNGFASLP